jgi:hypothetical protein
LIPVTIGSQDGKNQINVAVLEEWDTGTSICSNGSGPDLMGRLCRRVLALIKYKVSADVAVSEHMVRVLEMWLQKRGISIYTELDL